jgi:hypothetical protein
MVVDVDGALVGFSCGADLILPAPCVIQREDSGRDAVSLVGPTRRKPTERKKTAILGRAQGRTIGDLSDERAIGLRQSDPVQALPGCHAFQPGSLRVADRTGTPWGEAQPASVHVRVRQAYQACYRAASAHFVPDRAVMCPGWRPARLDEDHERSRSEGTASQVRGKAGEAHTAHGRRTLQ